jgi:hypothetical protein
MHMPAKSQHLVLTNFGFETCKIGDTISDIHSFPISPVNKYRHFDKLSLWAEDYFDYYFIDDSASQYYLQDSIKVSDCFIGATKSGIVDGFVFLVDKKDLSALTRLINRVFGPQALEANGGMGGETHRVKKLWSKNNISLFVTVTVSHKIRVEVTPRRLEGKTVWISFDD